MIVNVTKGELVYAPAEDCSRRSYLAGTAFVDPGHGHVRSAFNPTDEEAVLVATFYEAPEQGPLLIPAQPPEGLRRRAPGATEDERLAPPSPPDLNQREPPSGRSETP